MQAGADAFMEGLFAVSSVVLNGRAPGDAAGSHTCWQSNADGVVTRRSVVDLACASVSLFAAVGLFEVLPFRPSASKDHSALYVQLSDLAPRHYVAEPRRRRRVCRPAPSAYMSALAQAQPGFDAMLRAWRSGSVSVEQAMSQFAFQVHIPRRQPALV
jgi:hypothetical protein